MNLYYQTHLLLQRTHFLFTLVQESRQHVN